MGIAADLASEVPAPGVPRALGRALDARRARRHSAKKVACFHYAYYEPAFRYFVEHVLDCEFLAMPPVNREMEALGNAASSDFVCSPFKRIVGEYARALDAGADVLVQFYGFCRLTYYGELQEQVLRSMGYDGFQMLNFAEVDGATFRETARWCKRVCNSKLSVPDAAINLVGCYRMARHLDEFDAAWLARAAFGRDPRAFPKLRRAYFSAMDRVSDNAQIEQVHRRYMAALAQLPADVPADPVRIGVCGDFYTAADAGGNMGVEEKLLALGCSVARDMGISTRMIGYDEPKERRKVSEYLSYDAGPTTTFNAVSAKKWCRAGFDGIVHLKAAGCTPEIDAMPVLQRISADYGVPVLFLSFDSQTSDTGLQTRLEAFYDMVSMRKAARKGGRS